MAGKVIVGTMKATVAALVIVATIWCYPLAAEVTPYPCDALASQALRIEAGPRHDPGEPDTVALIKSLGDFVVSETVQRRYPWVPPGIVCTGYYWRLVADPAFVDAIANPSDAE